MNRSPKYNVQFSGLGLGEHKFEWFIDRTFFDEFENEDIQQASLNARLVLNKHDRLMNLSFVIDGNIETKCDHCGDSLTIKISTHNDLIARFAEETDLSGDEVIFLSNAEHTLDLSQHIYEFIVLAIPVRRSHEDGKCDPTIDRFLIHQEPEKATQKDPRWQALDKLRK